MIEELINSTKSIKEELLQDKEKISVFSAGRVLSCHDGVIMVEGLREIAYGELLNIEGKYALTLNLEKNVIGAILLSDGDVQAGSIAYSTGSVMSVPVGNALLGRVVDAMGISLDGKGEIKTKSYRPVEASAPLIFDRGKVNRPMYTGTKAIDTMIPIGKGQRELIIGDRGTGKTAIAIDAIINQKGKNVICVYVAIGQKASGLVRTIEKLRTAGAMSYTVVVSATAGVSAPQQYIAPYTGTAIAEEFMYSGKDVLIVYDDLSKHAGAYRTISLLMRRPSGREAYPGDVFYIHSRLLERSAQLNAAKGGGSLTALPIIETQAGDVSAYIPTNVISITDGQIYLESKLFNSGIRPAVNVGLSVSRVGGTAQCKAMREVASTLRLELAHYNEMKDFARFGGDFDESTRKVIEKGGRLVEGLKQKQYAPLPMSKVVVEIYLLSEGLVTHPLADQNKIIADYLDILGKKKDILQKIEEDGIFDEERKREIATTFALFTEGKL